MLRILISVIGGLMLLAGIALVVLPPHAGWGLLIFGGVLLLSLFFEGRYRTASASANAHWEATGEKFIDPGTGQFVEVQYDPATGERNYRQT